MGIIKIPPLPEHGSAEIQKSTMAARGDKKGEGGTLALSSATFVSGEKFLNFDAEDSPVYTSTLL